MPKKPAPIPKPFRLYWRRDDARECYRVWASTWFGDMFESISEGEMEKLAVVCRQFSIPLEEAADD